jgi:hypothetical protein
MIRSCGSCANYGPDDDTCRRDPPVRLPRTFAPSATAESRVRDEHILWGWPKVAEFDWCGRYKRRTDDD